MFNSGGRGMQSRNSMGKSKVVQIHISMGQVGDADAMFARNDNQGQPIVLIPDSPKVYCPSFCVTVPSGPWVLKQTWYNDQGQAPTGFHMMWCGWDRISHIVTRKGISYNHPVSDCPTSDNVMVRIDLSLNFQIGPEIGDAQKFVYTLGATRLDEMLSAETEEAIRALVNQVPVMKVLDLREEFTVTMKTGLNRTMNNYGVMINNVKITNVQLPASLEKTLQSRTSFETQMEQQEKKHAAHMRKLNDDARQRLEQIKKDNKRRIQDLTAETERAEINREERITAVQATKEVRVTEATSQAEVRGIQARSKKSVSVADAEKHATELVVRITAKCDAQKVEADQDFKSRKVRAEAGLAVKMNEAKGIEADASAEREGAKSLGPLRDFKVQQLRMNVLTGLAQNTNMVMTGETGEGVLEMLAPGGKRDMSGTKGK